MKFGKQYNDEPEETTNSGGAKWMKYFKDGDTTFRVLQEPIEWVEYWEHYNPGGFPFPCTGERKTCPGCTSSNEKMKKASKKIAFNVLEGEYVNVYKVPKTVADKLDNRARRLGTVTDRDYTISRIVSKNADGSKKYDYDIEGQDKIPVDMEQLRPKFADIEQMLGEAFEQAWGDPDKAQQTRDGAELSESSDNLKSKLAAAQQREWTEGAKEDVPDWATPPAENAEKVWTEEELRSLSVEELKKVCANEGVGSPPEELTSSDQIVDWLLDQ